MIPYGKHHVDEEDIKAVSELLRDGWLTQGPAIATFEKAVADYVGVKYAIALASGSAALHLATLAAGVNETNALVTTPITFVASANGALYAGGKVLFADVDPATINLSPTSLADVLQKHDNVRAVVPVHFAGLPCDMPAIKQMADEAGAVVIEDAAHALGANYPDGSGKVGNCAHALMTVFSFHPVKAIAAGEGGMITTNDEEVYRKLLRLRAHGINKLDDAFEYPEEAFTDGEPNPWYYEMQDLGYHYRITDIQCALAMSQLKKLDAFIARRRELTSRYDLAFKNFKNLKPAQSDGRDISGHHIYPVRINFENIGMPRNALMRALRSRDIGSQVHYIPVPTHPIYRKLGFDPAHYPAAQNYYSEALTIPLFYDLTDPEQHKIIDVLGELVG